MSHLVPFERRPEQNPSDTLRRLLISGGDHVHRVALYGEGDMQKPGVAEVWDSENDAPPEGEALVEDLKPVELDEIVDILLCKHGNQEQIEK